MLGLFKSYDDEYLELYEYLTQDWRMKPEYAKPFLKEYKKSVGKLLAEGKQRMSQLENSNDPELRLLRSANLGAEYPGALVAQAYYAYMGDLRRGKHVGTSIEKTIWAILSNRSDLLGNIDKPMEKWIDDKADEKFPGLFEEVFADSSDNTDEAKLLGVDQLDKTNSQDQMTKLVQKNRVPMDDENLYLIATNEVDSGQQDAALWAKAMALCEGDKSKAKYKYIDLRVEILGAETMSVASLKAREKLADSKDTNEPNKNQSEFVPAEAYAAHNNIPINEVISDLANGRLTGHERWHKWYVLTESYSPDVSVNKATKTNRNSEETTSLDSPKESMVSCSSCHTLVPSDQPTCTSCGKSFRSLNVTNSVVTNQTSDKSNYGGIGRAFFAVVLFGSLFAITFISVMLGLTLYDLIPFILCFLVILVLSYLRMKNIGKNPWISLLVLIPLVSLFIFGWGLTLPEGYQDSRKLDMPGKVASVIFVVALLFFFFRWFVY